MSDRNANKKFLEALNGADKKGALKALTDACGKDVSIEHLPKPDKSMNSIYALKAKCAAVRAKVQIAANAPDLTESHFVEAALGTYLNAGGKYEEFGKDLSSYIKEQNEVSKILAAQMRENRVSAM